MKFGAVPVEEAAGAVLAHSLSVSEGRIGKGTVLTSEHLSQLADAGHHHVTVARLMDGDLEENRAAEAVAKAIAPDPSALNVRISAAGAGRVNLYATKPGIVAVDEAKLRQLNSVDPMITIATLADATRVDPGTMLATIKIISYAVTEAAVSAACADVAGALRVQVPNYSTASLIETSVAGVQFSAKGRNAMEDRLSRLGMTLTPAIDVAHAEAPLAAAIQSAPGDVVFILTASATSDAQDVAPQALRDAGGKVAAFGMPVDPGNLLFFGDLEGKPVIGLPGCARSPALNGADWVMERLICGRTLTQQNISEMGVGGLLKEIPTRPRPRARRP